MEKRIVECVPNFSEGRDKAVIDRIVSAIETSGGVKVLDVDPGEATNRTVVTFVGSPEAVVEAAFAGVKKAAELIDMRKHKGAHPRMGATDVLPLIPIAGITLEECAELARKLAERIAGELHVPTYCYEAAAFTPRRRNLAVCREGEYEALPEKLAHEESAPDFGARPFDEGVARTGATTVGARDFLIAVNFNLNTTSTRRANAIAFDVREKGRPVREGNPITGKVVRDADGNPLMRPGTLRATKAIGWFIEEYGIAQVSMNITDIAVTPLHVAFDEVCRKADARGVRVSCETAPHYLLLCDEDLQEDGRFKMNPPLRSREDRAALIAGVADGTIEVIATDHAPHTAEEKSRGLAGSAMGIVGLECAFPLMYKYMVLPGTLTLEKLVALMSDNPRRIFGLGGGLNVGGEADFTVLALGAQYEIDPAAFLSKGRATPFAGWPVQGRAVLTVVGGREAYRDDGLQL